MGKLTQKQVANSKPGRIGDKGGSGLILETSPTLRRRWLIRFSHNKKVTEAALGPYPFIGLADARVKAFEFRMRLRSGLSGQAKHVAFVEVAREVLAHRTTSAKNGHAATRQGEWLLGFMKPLHGRAIASIDTSDVLGVLTPIWHEKPVAAERVRATIEQVLDAARVKGLREKDNVARWKGHLAHVLPARPTLPVGHHKALPYDQLPSLMRELERVGSGVARAMRFTILCALRKNETMNARWSDISTNGEGSVLTIPAERMKEGREFRLPLTPAALALIEEQRAMGAEGDLIFPSPTSGDKPMNVGTLNDLLLRLRCPATPHGVARSSFSDWAHDQTSFPTEVIEGCLAHQVGDATSRAYRRGDGLDKRRLLLEEWSTFLVRRQSQ